MAPRLLPLIALALLVSPCIAQPRDTSQPGRRPPAEAAPIDPATDAVLQAIKAAVDPTSAQWSTILDRYTSLRADQRNAMREIRRSVMGESGPPPGGRGGSDERERTNKRGASPPTADQHAQIDALTAERIDPMNQAFLGDVRAALTSAQRPKFDAIAPTLDLAPMRGGRTPGAQPSAPGGPLPPSRVTIEVADGVRTITANGIPNHPTGQFPGRGNPNTISAQSYTFRMPAAPKIADQPTPHHGTLAGVALNGVVFDPGTAEAWKNDPRSGWNIEAIAPEATGHMDLGLDANNAHVQPQGSYHYHAAPEGLIESLCAARGVRDGEVMLLLGWSADGFPIYDHHCYTDPTDATSPLTELHSSYQLRQGTRPDASASPPGPGGRYDGMYTQDYEFIAGSGDLDECNGRFGVTPEFPEGTYYYVITAEFPSISRMFRGTPDPSFARRGPPPSGGGRPGNTQR